MCVEHLSTNKNYNEVMNMPGVAEQVFQLAHIFVKDGDNVLGRALLFTVEST